MEDAVGAMAAASGYPIHSCFLKTFGLNRVTVARNALKAVSLTVIALLYYHRICFIYKIWVVFTIPSPKYKGILMCICLRRAMN